LIVILVKYGLSLGILAYLVYNAAQQEGFAELVTSPKDWRLVAAAFVVCLAALIIGILRWHMLVRALGIDFRVRDAFRMGFLGYLFNFVTPGSVGGDLFKAIFIAREHPGRRAEAVASVVFDRLIGLYCLMLLASGALLVTGQFQSADEQIRGVARLTFLATAAGAVVIGVMLAPGFTQGRVSRRLSQLPGIGRTLSDILRAVRIYRSKPGVLVASLLLTLVIQTCFTTGIFLLARALPRPAPSLADHFSIVPLSLLTGVLPFPNGLGAFEFALDYLYHHVPAGQTIDAGHGLIVALGYRLVTVAMAGVGVVFYLVSRREVAAVLHEAEVADAEDGPAAAASEPSVASAP
jgi:uncharacterized protein (TIRG00374 family)